MKTKLKWIWPDSGKVLCRALLTLLGLSLFLIGFSKLFHFDAFADVIAGYRIFPEDWIEPVAALIVGCEMTLAGGLCLPRFQRGSALGVIGMLLIFALAIAASLLHGMSIDCGCFGTLSGPMKISWWMVGRNLAIILGLGLMLAYTSRNGPESGSPSIRIFLAAHSRSLGCLMAMGIVVAALVWWMQGVQILAEQKESLNPSLRLKSGDWAPPVMVYPVGGGKTEKLVFAGRRKTVLLIFSSTCPHCQEAIQWWNTRLQSLNLQPNPPRVIGICLNQDIPPEFVRNFPIGFPVYLPSSHRKFTRDYRTPFVPLTIFINPAGKITYITQGFPPKMLEME